MAQYENQLCRKTMQQSFGHQVSSTQAWFLQAKTKNNKKKHHTLLYCSTFMAISRL